MCEMGRDEWDSPHASRLAKSGNMEAFHALNVALLSARDVLFRGLAKVGSIPGDRRSDGLGGPSRDRESRRTGHLRATEKRVVRVQSARAWGRPNGLIREPARTVPNDPADVRTTALSHGIGWRRTRMGSRVILERW